MANLCHYWSTASKTLEETAKTATSRQDLKDKIGIQTMVVTNELSHILNGSNPQTIGDLLATGRTFGDAKNTKKLSPSFYNDNKPYIATFNSVDLYDKIQSETKYPQELKNLTTELYLQANTLMQTQNINYRSLCEPSTSFYTYISDPLTGDSKGIIVPTNSSTMLQDITHTKISTGSHFNSALICAAGNNTDVQNKCHK